MQASSATDAGPTAEGVSDDPTFVAGQLGDLLRELFLDPRADHLGAIEERGLSLSQVRTLFVLACAGAPVAAGDLAERIGISPAAMSRSLDALARRRLVRRRESSSDRRLRPVEISAGGEAVVEELVALRNAGLQRFVANLEPEQRAGLSAALAAINPPEEAR